MPGRNPQPIGARGMQPLVGAWRCEVRTDAVLLTRLVAEHAGTVRAARDRWWRVSEQRDVPSMSRLGERPRHGRLSEAWREGRSLYLLLGAAVVIVAVAALSIGLLVTPHDGGDRRPAWVDPLTATSAPTRPVAPLPTVPADTSGATESVPWALVGMSRDRRRLVITSSAGQCDPFQYVKTVQTEGSVTISVLNQRESGSGCDLAAEVVIGYVELDRALGARQLVHAATE